MPQTVMKIDLSNGMYKEQPEFKIEQSYIGYRLVLTQFKSSFPPPFHSSFQLTIDSVKIFLSFASCPPSPPPYVPH